MALNKPRTVFGLSQMTAINRATNRPYGTIKVIQSYSGSLTREQIDLFGGNNPMPWDSEDGNVSADLSVTVSEFNPFLYTIAGYDVTSVASTSTGSASVVASSFSAATPTVTLAVSSDAAQLANLKSGVFMLGVTTSGVGATFDVYALNDTDFTVGTDLSYVTNALKITTAAIALSSAGQTVIPNTGISVSVAAASDVVSTDKFIFKTYKPNQGYNEVSYGAAPTPVEFGAFFTSQKKSNGEVVIDYYPRVKCSSVPAMMTAKEWVNADLTMKVLYDADLGYSFKRFDEVQDLT
jgi:hypothetical protein